MHIGLMLEASGDGLAGLEGEGLPIIGGVWTYYFTNALCDSTADDDESGNVSVEEAYAFSTPLVQKYMNETVFAVPEFLQMYHDLGIYPEDYDAYPHPVMDDEYSDQFMLDYKSWQVMKEYKNTNYISGWTIVCYVVVAKRGYGCSEQYARWKFCNIY